MKLHHDLPFARICAEIRRNTYQFLSQIIRAEIYSTVSIGRAPSVFSKAKVLSVEAGGVHRFLFWFLIELWIERKVIVMRDVSATTRKLQREIDIAAFLNEMTTGEVVSIDAPETPPWFQHGIAYEISDVTFRYFAETTILRWMDANSFAASEIGQTTKTVRETEAEAVSFIVCNAFGLDSATHSSDYIQLYEGNSDTLKESLKYIQSTAQWIVESIQAVELDCDHSLSLQDESGRPTGSWTIDMSIEPAKFHCRVCHKFYGYVESKSAAKSELV